MIRKSVLLPCDPVVAFSLFTERATDWWSADRRHTGNRASEIRMSADGRFWERATDGREVELGVIRVWDAPRQLVIDCFIGTGSDRPTALTVTFVSAGPSTHVEIDHRPLPISEDVYNERAPIFDRSWDLVLAALREAAQS